MTDFFTKFETVIETIILNLSSKFQLKMATFGLEASFWFRVGTLLLDPFVSNSALNVF